MNTTVTDKQTEIMENLTSKIKSAYESKSTDDFFYFVGYDTNSISLSTGYLFISFAVTKIYKDKQEVVFSESYDKLSDNNCFDCFVKKIEQHLQSL